MFHQGLKTLEKSKERGQRPILLSLFSCVVPGRKPPTVLQPTRSQLLFY